jgi:hypothetical protein
MKRKPGLSIFHMAPWVWPSRLAVANMIEPNSDRVLVIAEGQPPTASV